MDKIKISVGLLIFTVFTMIIFYLYQPFGMTKLNLPSSDEVVIIKNHTSGERNYELAYERLVITGDDAEELIKNLNSLILKTPNCQYIIAGYTYYIKFRGYRIGFISDEVLYYNNKFYEIAFGNSDFLEDYDYILKNNTIDTYFSGEYEVEYLGSVNGIEIYKEVDYACAEALEQIYVDEKYLYYLPCIESRHYAFVYNDNIHTIQDVLHKGLIKASDLDTVGIKYYKEEK